MPNLIVAAADTRSVLEKYGLVVSVWSSYYDEKAKPKEYINEFSQYAFGVDKDLNFYLYDKDFRAYVDFLGHLSKNPDLVKIAQLK